LRTNRESLLATESKSGPKFSSLGRRKYPRIKAVSKWQATAEDQIWRYRKRQLLAEK